MAQSNCMMSISKTVRNKILCLPAISMAVLLVISDFECIWQVQAKLLKFPPIYFAHSDIRMKYLHMYGRQFLFSTIYLMK